MMQVNDSTTRGCATNCDEARRWGRGAPRRVVSTLHRLPEIAESEIEKCSRAGSRIDERNKETKLKRG